MKGYEKFITKNAKHELKASEIRDLNEMESFLGATAWFSIIAGAMVAILAVAAILWTTKFILFATIAFFIMALIPVTLTIMTYKDLRYKIESVNKRLEAE